MVDKLEVPAFVTIPGVDIVATGEWDLASGTTTFTTDDMANAVEASECPAVADPVIKLGHLDSRFNPDVEDDGTYDGTPAVGRIRNLALAMQGNKVTGDLSGMPGWLGAVMPSAYPKRSVEGQWDYPCQNGHIHPFVITGLALLGVTPPGVGVLNNIADVAALYGVAASGNPAGRRWRLNMEAAAMPKTARAAGTTTEDVRRAWIGTNPPWSQWITEMQLDPTAQLIVADDSTAKVYRVPFTVASAGEVEFGDPVEVEVEYVDKAAATKAAMMARIAAARGTGQVVTYASREASRTVTGAWDGAAQVKNLGTSPSAAQLKALYALPGDTKSDSKLPHHTVSSDGVVGAADDDGCSAAIAAINGGRGGLKGVSAGDLKKAYNHLAAHLKADGKDAPDFNAAARIKRLGKIKAAAGDGGDTDADDSVKALIASLDATLDEASTLASNVDAEGLPEDAGQALALIVAAETIADQLMELLGIYDPDDAGDSVTAAMKHGPFTGTHAHAHSAMGSQGGDAGHDHSHTHQNDAVHAHVHAAGGNQGKEGRSKVDLTDDHKAALRKSLGLAEDDELTPDALVTAAEATRTKLEAAEKVQVAASKGKLPEGAMVVDRDAWNSQQEQIKRLVSANKRSETQRRDETITAAIRAGKIPAAARDRYEKAWAKDSENTESILASMPKGVIPVDAIGEPGGDPLGDDFDADYDRVFGGASK